LVNSVLHYLPSHAAVDRAIEQLASVAGPGARLVIADLPVQRGVVLDVVSQLAHGIRRGALRDVVPALVRAAVGSSYASVRRRHGVLIFDRPRLDSLARGFGGRAIGVRGSLTANASRRHLVVRRPAGATARC
jgi:hypothetical protein